VSLGVAGELLSRAVDLALLLLRQPMICPNRWSNKYLSENKLKGNEAPSVRETMLSNGWCPWVAKNTALQKIRDVYQSARHVLVLDASLEAYKVEEMTIVEKLARIYTSSWLRRLWTL